MSNTPGLEGIHKISGKRMFFDPDGTPITYAKCPHCGSEKLDMFHPAQAYWRRPIRYRLNLEDEPIEDDTSDPSDQGGLVWPSQLEGHPVADTLVDSKDLEDHIRCRDCGKVVEEWDLEGQDE